MQQGIAFMSAIPYFYTFSEAKFVNVAKNHYLCALF